MENKVQEAIKTLDEVIPAPCDKMVDAEHLKIALAWRTVKECAAEAPGWISVTEAIPEDQEEVLVCTLAKNGTRNIDKGYWAIDHFIHRGCAQVTHWMPLPKFPKDDRR